MLESGALHRVGLDFDREVALPQLGKESIGLEIFLGSPNARAQGPAENLLNSNGHVHGSAGIGVLLVQRVRVPNHTTSDAAAFAIPDALSGGEVNLVGLLGGDAAAVLGDVAIDDRLQNVDGFDGNALDRYRLVHRAKAGLDQPNPRFMIAGR